MLVAAAVLTVVGLSMGALFSAGLKVHEGSQNRDSLCRTANVALIRMKTLGTVTNRLFVPNATNATAHALAFASMIDEDGDGLFNEDPPNYADMSQTAGIKGVDDDGDGTVDEGDAADEDEDGKADEDPINGLDDDGDGRKDEDPPADQDWTSGTPEPDDDGDDQDGEDPYQPIVYWWDSQAKKLYERHPTYGENVIAESVTAFETKLTVGANGQYLVCIYLKLEAEDGRELESSASIFVRNASGIGQLPPPVDPGGDAQTPVLPPDEPPPPELPDRPSDGDDDD